MDEQPFRVLKLTPKTKKGKQAIQQGLGDIVVVIEGPKPVQCFHGDLGLFIGPVETGNAATIRNAVFKAPRDWCSRWIRVDNDHNFSYVDIPGAAFVEADADPEYKYKAPSKDGQDQ